MLSLFDLINLMKSPQLGIQGTIATEVIAAAESCHPFSLNAPSDSAAALATTLMTPARV